MLLKTVIVLTIVGLVGSSSNVDPQNVTDSYSNFANGNSTIKWGSVPAGDPYQTDTTYDSAGLQPLFDFARSFLSTIQPKDFPFDTIKDLTKGKFETSQIQSLGTDYFIGWGVCIVLGLLFIFLMPIVGGCFCCCRCCGNCGGSKTQDPANYENGKCRRFVFGILLLICIIFMGAGMVCTYVNNSRFTAALKETKTRSNSSLGDVTRYLDNTINAIEFVAQKGFNFTKRVIVRDLDNIGVLVGIPVQSTLGTTGGVNSAISGIIGLDTSVQSLSSTLLSLNDSVNNLKNMSELLLSALATERTSINNTLATCGALCNSMNVDSLNVDFNFNNLDDLSSNMDKMKSVSSKNLTALALDGKKEFDDIPKRVTNDTQSTVNSMKDLLKDMDKTIDNALGGITGLTNSTSSITDIEKTIVEYVDIALKYDNYRAQGGNGLTSVILVIVVLMFLGLLMGLCGSSASDPADKRSGLSNCGGNLLMSAVGLMFIFSWLFMLLVFIIFLTGGMMERNICQPIRDKSAFKELIDGPDSVIISGTGYPLGEMILQNRSINLTMSGILENCGKNQAAYSAMRLDALFDLTAVTDYKKTINLTAEIDKLDTDFSTLTILTPETRQQLNDFSDGLDINFTSFTTELTKNATQVDLVAYANELNVLAGVIAASKPAEAANLNTSADNLREVNKNEVYQVTAAKGRLKTSMNNFESAVGPLPTQINSSIDTITTSETYLRNQGSGLVKNVAQTYGNRVIGTADQFAAHALKSVQEDLGKCKAVSDIWKSLVEILLCSYIVDALNGFWFSFGWCLFFFIPSIIFSVKLAKHFKTMDNTADNYGKGQNIPMNAVGPSNELV